MAAFSRSARIFMERAGLLPTTVGPYPTVQKGSNPANSLPLEPPLPDPILLRGTQGCPPPDRGQSVQWPYGTLPE